MCCQEILCLYALRQRVWSINLLVSFCVMYMYIAKWESLGNRDGCYSYVYECLVNRPFSPIITLVSPCTGVVINW